jgi:hypothetical protein
MREIRPYGSVRGAASDGRPYRDNYPSLLHAGGPVHDNGQWRRLAECALRDERTLAEPVLLDRPVGPGRRASIPTAGPGPLPRQYNTDGKYAPAGSEYRPVDIRVIGWSTRIP